MDSVNIQEIYTDCIDLPAENMRTEINREDLYELAANIKKNGLINPIMVRPKEERFELVAGQRRFLAHQIAGIIKIKCVVRDLTDDEALSVMTSENLERADVNPIDEANHVGRLLAANNNDIDAVAKIVSRGRAWVQDRIAVAGMPDYLQIPLGEGKIKLGVALILTQIKNEVMRDMWARQAVRDGITIPVARYWLAQSELVPEDITGAISAPPKQFMLRCTLDGKEYPAELFTSVLVFKENLVFIDALRDQLMNPSGVESDLVPPN